MNPIPLWVRKIWNAWDIRVMVILSLILQITLFVFGKRRRSSVNSLIIFTVWSAYLIADWLATAALGKLTEVQVDSSNINSPTNQLRALWAPLLLLHLGGPDTITAYAVEDNKLWLRHLVVIVGQSLLVIYVVLLSWTGSWLSFLTLPIFLAAVIKNWERIFILINSASIWEFTRFESKGLRTERPNHGSGHVYSAYEKADLADSLFITFMPNALNSVSLSGRVSDQTIRLDNEIAADFKPPDSGVTISSEYLENEVGSIDIIELFGVVAIELGFLFDELYTKATVTYTRLGCKLRFTSFFCSLSVLLVFFLIVLTKEKSCQCHSDIDISITAVLLAGAVVLELYGIAMALSSEKAMLWITYHRGNRLVWKIFNSFPWLFAGHKKKRYWSNSMGQFSLLGFCLNHRPGKLSRIILEMFGIDKMLRLFWHKSFVDVRHVPESLEEVIKELLSGPPPITASRGEKALEKLGCEDLKWSCTGSVFDESIITWHIATDICYYHNSDPNVGDNSEAMRRSKILSDYMMYLLVMHPSMFLPPHHHELRLYELDQALNILTQFFKEEGRLTDIRQDYTLLLRKGADSDDQDAVSKAKLLAKELIKKDNKWDVIQNVWVETLCYAAIKSDRSRADHAQQLTSGGQFLTHLWLLLLHKIVLKPRVDENSNDEV